MAELAEAITVKTLDKVKGTKDIAQSLKGKVDGHVNALSVVKLLDDGGEYQRPPGILLSDYTIDYAQFCQQPLESAFLDIGIALYKSFNLIPTITASQTSDMILEMSGISKNDSALKHRKWLPTPHHRFIRFRTNECCLPSKHKVWGILERIEDGIICALYKSERESLRSDACVAGFPASNFLAWPKPVELDDVHIGVEEVFRGIGGQWNGKYHLIKNNCIHYALECWRWLGGNAEWDDVVDGNVGHHPRYNPAIEDIRRRNRLCYFT